MHGRSVAKNHHSIIEQILYHESRRDPLLIDPSSITLASPNDNRRRRAPAYVERSTRLLDRSHTKTNEFIMIENDLCATIEEVLKQLDRKREIGAELSDPPLEILGYYQGAERLGAVPWFGRGLSATVVARQPLALSFKNRDDYRRFIRQLAFATRGRFSPWKWTRGPALTLAVVVLTAEPIEAEDDQILAEILNRNERRAAAVTGIIRLNLAQEAMAVALKQPPGDRFADAALIAESLSTRFRRFVPLFNPEP